MKNLPFTESALIIRTAFSDQPAWDRMIAAARKPDDPFIFNMEVIENREYEGATVGQLIGALPDEYPHSFMVVVDQVAISQPGHPMLIVDLLEGKAREFRSLPSQVASIDNNLSIANMSFEEFAEAVDETGVFRGFPEM